MNTSSRLKFIWGIILFIIYSYLLSLRLDSIVAGSVTVIDIIILLIWTFLLFAPLFQEVKFFGIDLKKEIDTLRQEFREQIINLRSEIQNSVSVLTQVNPEIHFHSTSEELAVIKERVDQIYNHLKKDRKVEDIDLSQIKIPDSVSFLFSVRYTIEKELKRISKKYGIHETRFYPIYRVINSLVNIGVLDHQFANALREVLMICSKAIHGEEVPESNIKFVKDVAPKLIAYLREL